MYATQILYLLIITVVKYSILLFYLRLSPSVNFRRWVKAAAAAAACVFEDVVFTLIVLFQCNPIEKAWDFVVLGKCSNGIGCFKAETTFSLATNVVILVLLMPMIWNLHLILRGRLLLIGIFAVGLMWVHQRVTPSTQSNSADRRIVHAPL